jgi:hypothetical protein
MPTQVQFRRGTETQNDNFTGGAGELTISTTDYTLRIHDGTTAGGHEQAKADLSNATGDTDQITEGSTNLYYTNARVDAEIDSYLSAGTGITLAGSGSIAVDTSVIATVSYVDSQISATIDAAPDALNTLNELAAALGDDANFSTTITNSLATKAPLASASLTGTPTAPTASTGTNTTQIATTAFVQQEITALKALLYAYDQS